MHEAKAMQIDVVSVQGEEIFQAQRAKMLMPIDWNIVDRSVLDPRQFRHAECDRRSRAVVLSLLQQEDVAGRASSEFVGRFLER